MFRGDYEELNILNDNIYNTNINNINNINYILNNDLRLSNLLKLRSTVKNSIVTYNAIQKVFKPRYDEGKYSFQIESARNFEIKISIALIYRLMLDIDTTEDLHFVLNQKIKPELCEKIKKIMNDHFEL